jgi:hypothetical protein
LAGYAVEADNPIFGEHLTPLNRFFRSRSKADAECTIDRHPAAVLIEIGLSEDRVAELEQQKIIGL